MATQTTTEQDTLGAATVDMVRRPRATLVSAWNWKAAAVSALLRASIFLVANRHTGAHRAEKAVVVEIVFSIFASGLLGAVTQRLRDARPLWATAVVVWLGMPALMLVAQYGVHHAFGTPHVRTGLAGSFVFAAFASGFTWYAMRRGTLLTGIGNDSVLNDVRAMPRVVLDFVIAGPRWLWRSSKSGNSNNP